MAYETFHEAIESIATPDETPVQTGLSPGSGRHGNRVNKASSQKEINIA
ncbi:hypothetical protein PT2222_110229 [Paraburkholderia tropica]